MIIWPGGGHDDVAAALRCVQPKPMMLQCTCMAYNTELQMGWEQLSSEFGQDARVRADAMVIVGYVRKSALKSECGAVEYHCSVRDMASQAN